MTIKTIPRERIFVSEDQIFSMREERNPQHYSSRLRPTPIPEYIVQLLIEESKLREELANAQRLRN